MQLSGLYSYPQFLMKNLCTSFKGLYPSVLFRKQLCPSELVSSSWSFKSPVFGWFYALQTSSHRIWSGLLLAVMAAASLREQEHEKKTNTSEVFQYVDFKHLQQQRDGLFDSNSSFSKKTSDRTQEQRNLLHSFLPSHPLINSKVALAQCYKIKVVEIFSFWNMEYIIRMSDSCIWKGVPLHVWMQQWGIDVLHTSPSPFLIRVETFDLMKLSFSNMKLLNHLGFVCFSQLRLSWKSVDGKILNKLERKELLPFKIVYFYWSGNISEIENKYWF